MHRCRTPEALEFPAVWPNCPFPVEEFPIEDEDFDVEIVFEQPVGVDSLSLIGGPIAAWLRTTTAGVCLHCGVTRLSAADKVIQSANMAR